MPPASAVTSITGEMSASSQASRALSISSLMITKCHSSRGWPVCVTSSFSEKKSISRLVQNVVRTICGACRDACCFNSVAEPLFTFAVAATVVDACLFAERAPRVLTFWEGALSRCRRRALESEDTMNLRYRLRIWATETTAAQIRIAINPWPIGQSKRRRTKKPRATCGVRDLWPGAIPVVIIRPTSLRA